MSNVISQTIQNIKNKMYVVPEDIAKNNDLDAKIDLLKNIKRSFSVFRIDCGGCNGCEIEIYAAISPLWDPERFGFKLVANPRHADILLVTGPVTRQMYYPLLRAYEAAPDPKIVVAFGACGSSGGIFHDSYAVWSGVDKVIDTDVFIPGCPPHPASIIYGLGVAVGILEQKLEKQSYQDGELELNIHNSLIDNLSFERDILAESKRLMSYVYGRALSEKFLEIVKNSEPKDALSVKKAVEDAMDTEEDKRYSECFMLLYNNIYLKYIKGESISKKLVGEKW